MLKESNLIALVYQSASNLSLIILQVRAMLQTFRRRIKQFLFVLFSRFTFATSWKKNFRALLSLEVINRQDSQKVLVLLTALDLSLIILMKGIYIYAMPHLLDAKFNCLISFFNNCFFHFVKKVMLHAVDFCSS